jgi:hypothetical protein
LRLNSGEKGPGQGKSLSNALTLKLNSLFLSEGILTLWLVSSVLARKMYLLPEPLFHYISYR